MDPEAKITKLIDAKIQVKKTNVGKFVINYAFAGKGMPLLLLHGTNIGWGQWYANISEFSKHFQVYAIDLPGSGKSTKVNFKGHDFTETFVETVERFISNNNLKGAHVIGHSLGAVIASKIVAKRGNSLGKIVLVSPLGFTDSVPWNQKLLSFYPIAKLLSHTVMKPTRENVAKFLQRPLYNKTVLKNEFIDYYYNSIMDDILKHPFFMMNSLMSRLKIKKELVLVNEFLKISNKTLIVAGEKDPIVSLKNIYNNYKLIPNAKLKVFHETGHVAPIEKSDEFNKLVIEFLT